MLQRPDSLSKWDIVIDHKMAVQYLFLLPLMVSATGLPAPRCCCLRRHALATIAPVTISATLLPKVASALGRARLSARGKFPGLSEGGETFIRVPLQQFGILRYPPARQLFNVTFAD